MRSIGGVSGDVLVPARRLARDQRGVTGLETAIILIAFVVVASVFAFTVLSTGIFSAERGKETIHAGLKEARSSIEVKGSVFANGVIDKTVNLADSAWTDVTYITSADSIWISATSTVTVASSTSDKQEGTASAQLTLDATLTAVLAAYENLSPTVDLSSEDSVRLWVKSSVTTSAGDLEIVVNDNAGCATPLENTDIPVLVSGAWTLVTAAIADNSDMTAAACVGLNVVTDLGAQVVNLDYILGLARIHRRTSLGTALEEASGCPSESGVMVLEQKPARKQGAPNRCCHRTNPTVSASSLTTIAWWPMPACSCRPP